jgi:hypothetical protein
MFTDDNIMGLVDAWFDHYIDFSRKLSPSPSPDPKCLLGAVDIGILDACADRTVQVIMQEMVSREYDKGSLFESRHQT